MSDVEIAVEAERQRCVDACMEQYRYWRTSLRDEQIEDFAAGAMGASANILCSILGVKVKTD